MVSIKRFDTSETRAGRRRKAGSHTRTVAATPIRGRAVIIAHGWSYERFLAEDDGFLALTSISCQESQSLARYANVIQTVAVVKEAAVG